MLLEVERHQIVATRDIQALCSGDTAPRVTVTLEASSAQLVLAQMDSLMVGVAVAVAAAAAA